MKPGMSADRDPLHQDRLRRDGLHQDGLHGEPLHEAGDTRCFTVIVSGETFGLPIEAVQTIFRIEEVTPVPLGPDEILGLVNLRGKIVTAVSLRRRLRIKEETFRRGLLAIGIEHRGEHFALVVDEVGDVITLDPKCRIPLPPHLDPLSISLTNAVYRIETEILPILDMTSVFDFQRRNPFGESGMDK